MFQRTRYTPVAGLILGVLWVLVPRVAQAQAPAEERPGPNIVFIMLDDAGYSDFGAYGSESIQTPYFDQLAAEGMRLTSFYANGGICSPTRTALLTGRYPSEFGMLRQVIQASHRGIPGGVVMLPEVLKRQGYATGHFGKWHVGHRYPSYLPTENGYDHAVVDHYGIINDYYNPTFILDDGKPVTHTKTHATEATTGYALDFIRENADRPFFVQLWYHAPHRPLDPPSDWAARYPDDARGKYAALISDVDEDVGKVLSLLEELGVEDETLVVMTSDNGATLGDRAATSPFRGGKDLLFEGGIRVPLVARWPGRIAPGVVNDSVVVGFDWYPTLAELAGAPQPATEHDGMSITELLLENKKVKRDEVVIWESKKDSYPGEPGGFNTTFAVRRGKWKLVYDHDHMIGVAPKAYASLYDVASDPKEAQDLRNEYPRVAEELLEAYAQWRLKTGLVSHRVGRESRDANVDGTRMAFPCAGSVTLEQDTRFNTSDASMTVFMTVELDAYRTESVIAEKSGSWSISVDSKGTVTATAHDGIDRTATLVSDTQLELGREYGITLVYDGYRHQGSRVRLYVNDVLEDEVRGVRSLQVARSPIVIGNTREESAPLLGVIDHFNFYLNALTGDEVTRLVGRYAGQEALSLRRAERAEGGSPEDQEPFCDMLESYIACSEPTLALPGLGSEVEFKLTNVSELPLVLSRMNIKYDGKNSHESCGKFSLRGGGERAGHPSHWVLKPRSSVYVVCNSGKGATIEFTEEAGTFLELDFEFDYSFGRILRRASGTLGSFIEE